MEGSIVVLSTTRRVVLIEIRRAFTVQFLPYRKLKLFNSNSENNKNDRNKYWKKGESYR